MTGARTAIALLCLSAVLSACGQAGSSSHEAAPANTAAESIEPEVTSLPGDAACAEVMAWASAGWKVVRSLDAAGATSTQARALRSLSDRAQGLAVRTEDPLLTLIAAVGAFEQLLAEGKQKVDDQDVQKNALAALRQISQVCKTDLG